MRALAALFSGLILVGLLIASLGVPNYGGPHADPKCRPTAEAAC